MNASLMTLEVCVMALGVVLMLAVSIGAFGLFQVRNRLEWFG